MMEPESILSRLPNWLHTIKWLCTFAKQQRKNLAWAGRDRALTHHEFLLKLTWSWCCPALYHIGEQLVSGWSRTLVNKKASRLTGGQCLSLLEGVFHCAIVFIFLVPKCSRPQDNSKRAQNFKFIYPMTSDRVVTETANLDHTCKKTWGNYQLSSLGSSRPLVSQIFYTEINATCLSK